MKVVITMPAYRAAATLEKTVADIPEGVAHELILVDDASPDDTAAIAKQLGITVYVHPENRGYGGNQKTCYTEAIRHGADIVVLLHPDYQYDPKAVPLLIAPILAGDADMTFGSRFAGLGNPRAGGMPLYRFAGNRITTVLENLMLGSRFSEMHSGMRAYTRECLLSLPFLSYSDDFWFDSQTVVDAVTLGLRVVEIPIPTRYTKESSSIAIGSSLRYITESLSWCARKSAERGRRGRRSLVARARKIGPPPVRPDATLRNGNGSGGSGGGVWSLSAAPPAARDLAANYLLPTGDVLRARPGDATPAENEAAAIVVEAIDLHGAGAGGAKALRHATRDDGLVLVTGAGDRTMRPRDVIAVLVAAGFKAIDALYDNHVLVFRA